MIISNKPEKVKYKCKENDCEIILFLNDGKIDELHIGVRGEREWTVIGYKDLKKAIKKAKNDNKYKALR